MAFQQPPLVSCPPIFGRNEREFQDINEKKMKEKKTNLRCFFLKTVLKKMDKKMADRKGHEKRDIRNEGNLHNSTFQWII